MALRTRVVVTAVGPYSKYGLPLVAGCAKAGTVLLGFSGGVSGGTIASILKVFRGADAGGNKFGEGP